MENNDAFNNWLDGSMGHSDETRREFFYKSMNREKLDTSVKTMVLSYLEWAFLSGQTIPLYR